MPDFILQSKLVQEKIEVTFDFTDELAWGETIDSASLSVEVFTGEDTSPQLMLTGRTQRLTTTVSQQYFNGIPGVIYLLICDAVGSLGSHMRKMGKLAVLPANAYNPPLVENFVTTPPYPLEVSEALAFAVAPSEGRLKYQPFPTEAMAASVSPLTGDLYGSGTSFSIEPEAMSATVEPLTGSLYGSGTSFYAPVEGMTASVSPYSADLFGAGISYTMLPEEIQFTVTPLSGTLS